MVAKRKPLDWVTRILVVVGALNWGLVALGYNLVNLILGSVPVLENIVYGLVGIAAIYEGYKLTK